MHGLALPQWDNYGVAVGHPRHAHLCSEASTLYCTCTGNTRRHFTRTGHWALRSWVLGCRCCGVYVCVCVGQGSPAPLSHPTLHAIKRLNRLNHCEAARPHKGTRNAVGHRQRTRTNLCHVQGCCSGEYGVQHCQDAVSMGSCVNFTEPGRGKKQAAAPHHSNGAQAGSW